MSRKLRRRVKLLTDAQLRALPLPRLRAYHHRLYAVHDSPDREYPDRRRPTKQDPAWVKTVELVRAEYHRRNARR
jgi:hypothetical protein